MPFYIDPPLLNSANPWATTIDELRSLYDCEYTGAVTTRTCTLQGFAHDDAIHQYTFFDPQTLQSSSSRDGSAERTASLNTLGYSPISLPNLIELLVGFCDELRARRSDPSNTKVARKDKPFIISITGTPEELKQCYAVIKSKYLALCEAFPVYIEINLSCPNISGIELFPDINMLTTNLTTSRQTSTSILSLGAAGILARSLLYESRALVLVQICKRLANRHQNSAVHQPF